jgi:hypothetical protein
MEAAMIETVPFPISRPERLSALVAAKLNVPVTIVGPPDEVGAISEME